MHPPEGELRAYLDQQLENDQVSNIQQHLTGCPACRQMLVDLSERAAAARQRFNSLAPPAAHIPAWQSAHRRLQARHTAKEQTPMYQRFFSRATRPAWAILALVLILSISMAFPGVRAAANSFLGLFRVQKVAVVQINPNDLPNQLGSSAQFESLFAENVQIEERGEAQEVTSAAEASLLSGFSVRLPQALQDPDKLTVQPGGTATFTVQLALVQAVLEEIGRADIQVPPEVDGARVVMDIPSGVTAMYGECSFDMETVRRNSSDPDNPRPPRLPQCTTLVQMPSPTVDAPPGLDLNQLGEAYLQLLGMSQEEAQRFSNNVDWATTFVIPIPRNGTSYQDVSVDGVSGTFIQQDLEGLSAQYLLIWVKDGLLYALTGPGQVETALEIAASLK